MDFNGVMRAQIPTFKLQTLANKKTCYFQYVMQLAILKHLYLNNFGFSATPCSLKAFGVCAEDFWIRTDFHHEVRW